MIQYKSRIFIECDFESERNLNWDVSVVIHTLEQGSPSLPNGHWWKILNGVFVEIPPPGTVINNKLFCSVANKTIANTVTETSLIGTGIGTQTLLPIFFSLGNSIRINIRGFFSKASGNATLKIKLNSTVISTTGTVLPGSAANDAFEIDYYFTVRSLGVSGSIIGQGNFFNWNTGNNQQMVTLAPITIDTTINQIVDVSYQWGTANVGNTITSTNVIYYV